MGRIFIGTSGWQYPHWRGVFYPENLGQKDWLRYYAQYFDTVEVNATFYHQMKQETFAKWRETVGKDFIFSIKASRYITHIKRLKNCQEEVKRFFEATNGLMDRRAEVARQQFFSESNRSFKEEKSYRGNSLGIPQKIGRAPRAPTISDLSKIVTRHLLKRQISNDVILWQLPPRFKADLPRLESFLQLIHSRSVPQAQHHSGSVYHVLWRQAFEFRDKSWMGKRVFKLLRDYGVAVVFQDYPGWPITQVVTAGFVYLRFHGKESLYASCYSDKELDLWSKKVKQWSEKGLDVYGFFNNDSQGHAVQNALQLKKLLGHQ